MPRGAGPSVFRAFTAPVGRCRVDYARLRRQTLWSFIGFLVLTAVIAIVALVGGKSDPLQWKILGTTFTISAASICAMSCAAFIDRKKAKAYGLLGILLSLVTACLVIFGIWSDISDDAYWKTTGTAIVCTAAFAHSFLLLLPDLGPRGRWVQRASLVSIGVLVLQIVAAVWTRNYDETYQRLLAAVAVVVALETLVIPILRKLRTEDPPVGTRLVLEQVEGAIYKDSSGRKFEVKALS